MPSGKRIQYLTLLGQHKGKYPSHCYLWDREQVYLQDKQNELELLYYLCSKHFLLIITILQYGKKKWDYLEFHPHTFKIGYYGYCSRYCIVLVFLCKMLPLPNFCRSWGVHFSAISYDMNKNIALRTYLDYSVARH